MSFNNAATGETLPSVNITLPIIPQSGESLRTQEPATFVSQPVSMNEKTSVVPKENVGTDAEGTEVKSMIIVNDNMGLKMLPCSLTPAEIAAELPDTDLGNNIREKIIGKPHSMASQHRLFNAH